MYQTCNLENFVNPLKILFSPFFIPKLCFCKLESWNNRFNLFYNQNVSVDPSTSLFTRLPVDSSRATCSSVTVRKIFVIISVWDLHFVSLGFMLSREFLRAGLAALSYRSLPHDTHKSSLNNTWLDVHRVGFEEGIASSSFLLLRLLY